MGLTADTKNRLGIALTSTSAASEMENLLGLGFGGKVYYVSSASGVGSNNADGLTWSTPFATLAYALTKVVASKGEVIVLMPGHAETITASAFSVAGIRVVGIGTGTNRPTLTATTAATDLINVTAANVYMENIRLVGAASGCTALLDIAGANFHGVGLIFEHGAAPLNAVTVPGAFANGRLVDCIWRGTGAGPDYCIYFENGATTGKIIGWQIIRPKAFYSQSSGLDNAFFRADRKIQDLLIEDPIVISFDTLAVDINSSSAAVGDGVVRNGSFIATAALTSIEDAFDVGGVMFDRCFVGDAVTGRPGPVPLGTVS